MNTELEKVNALTRLKETLIRQNVINEEKISLKNRELDLKERDIEVQKERNEIFRQFHQCSFTFVDVANAILSPSINESENYAFM